MTVATASTGSEAGNARGEGKIYGRVLASLCAGAVAFFMYVAAFGIVAWLAYVSLAWGGGSDLGPEYLSIIAMLLTIVATAGLAFAPLSAAVVAYGRVRGGAPRGFQAGTLETVSEGQPPDAARRRPLIGAAVLSIGVLTATVVFGLALVWLAGLAGVKGSTFDVILMGLASLLIAGSPAIAALVAAAAYLTLRGSVGRPARVMARAVVVAGASCGGCLAGLGLGLFVGNSIDLEKALGFHPVFLTADVLGALGLFSALLLAWALTLRRRQSGSPSALPDRATA